MTVFEFLNPFSLWRIVRKILVNVKNWNFYVKQMRVLNDNGTLKQMGMRLDMRARAYYVLNLEPETLMMGAEVLDLERSRVMESINSRKGAFEKAELIELIEIKTNRIKTADYYAYLVQVKYRPSATLTDWAYSTAWSTLVGSISLYFFANWNTLAGLTKNIFQNL